MPVRATDGAAVHLTRMGDVTRSSGVSIGIGTLIQGAIVRLRHVAHAAAIHLTRMGDVTRSSGMPIGGGSSIHGRVRHVAHAAARNMAATSVGHTTGTAMRSMGREMLAAAVSSCGAREMLAAAAVRDMSTRMGCVTATTVRDMGARMGCMTATTVLVRAVPAQRCLRT
ncbi:MAG TPA: hypothetical protein VGH65_00460 [Verrucomicrobiaceae bacterium]